MAEDFPSLEAEKESQKFAGRLWRFLQFLKSLQILSQDFILPKKIKPCSQKILPFRSGLFGLLGFGVCGFGKLALPLLGYLTSFFRNALTLNSQKLRLSLIYLVAGQIRQILQITAVICRILQIPPGSVNRKE